jgi:hypothetical protein
MKWPSVDELSALVPMPDGYRIDRFDRASIAPLITAIKEWHPHISVGAASCFARRLLSNKGLPSR